MIKDGEIHKNAGKHGVNPKQIEKDYILSWMLWGIAGNEFLSEKLVFKGGTCLKKIYFEVYRFSEDLDFTLLDDSVLDEDLYREFDSVFREIFEHSRIRIQLVNEKPESHKLTGGTHFYCHYVGPLGGKGDEIKVDITRGEKILFDIHKGKIYQEYSDLTEFDDNQLQSYPLEEVLIEKMVALMGRLVPRDLYDFNYLTEIEEMDLGDVFCEFEDKAKNKGRNPDEFIQVVEGKEGRYKAQWNKNLAYQIKDLDKFEDVWRSIKKQFRIIAKLQSN